MDSNVEDEDIKPTIPDDIPVESLHTVAVPDTGKLKQSRYEDVWPEDVHAAFMEAVALYPPMGKRRLKYYRVSTHENEHSSDNNRVKSFGRCQLIQSYILEKTGKNRSRKQVSSHLQRLKKIHKDSPTMSPLFSERSEHPSEQFSGTQAIAITPEDISTNASCSPHHPKSDFEPTIKFQNISTAIYGTNSLPTFSGLPEISSFNSGSSNAFDISTSFRDQPSYLFPQDLLPSHQYTTGTLYHTDSDHLSELQEPSLFRYAKNGGIRAGPTFNASAFSTSSRRLASKLSAQTRQVDLSPTLRFPYTAHSPGFYSAHQWIPYGSLASDVSCSSPLHLSEQFHTTCYPLQLFPLDNGRFEPTLASDRTWPQNRDISLDSRDLSGFGEGRLRHTPAIHHWQYSPAYPETRDNSPGSYRSLAKSESSQLSKDISHPCALTSAVTISASVSNESAIDFPGCAAPESPRNIASPLVIRPTPVYPISYIHSDYTPTANLPL